MSIDRLWLPEGHHWDLHIEHHPTSDNGGSFTGGGHKLTWHITVSPWGSVDAMVDTLIAKRAEPHLVIGGRHGGDNHPVVVQLLPFNIAARALQHTFAQQTNRANTIQVEICAEPDEQTAREHGAPMHDVVAHWGDWRYKALANLAGLISHRVDIPTRQARKFTNTQRFGPQKFVDVAGHCGHMHVPGNDHTDPTTAFRGAHLMNLIKSAPHKL